MRRFSCHSSKSRHCGARENASRANSKASWSLAHSSALNDRIVPWRSRRKTQYFVKSAAPECAVDDVFNTPCAHHLTLEWVQRRRCTIGANFISEMKNIHQSRLGLGAQSAVNGFSSECLTGAGPRAVRIMSMRARNAAGTCRCPGYKEEESLKGGRPVLQHADQLARSMRLARLAEALPAISWPQTVGSLER
jgi:hypothetical protein